MCPNTTTTKEVDVTRDASSGGRVDNLGRVLPMGVYYYPGRPKPYLVRIGRGSRGEMFATYERAVVRAEELRELRSSGVAPPPLRATERTLARRRSTSCSPASS